MNLLRLLSWHTDLELQDDDDEETKGDDLPAVEWTRQRVPTDQERHAYDEGLRRHVAQLSAVVDPFRPRLQPRLSQTAPETTPQTTGLRLTTEAPTSAGFYLMRSRSGHPWQVVEIIADVHGDLWYGWGSVQPARRVGGSRLQWCQPALGSVPG